jgi:hypothetical protein
MVGGPRSIGQSTARTVKDTASTTNAAYSGCQQLYNDTFVGIGMAACGPMSAMVAVDRAHLLIN